MEQVRFLDRGTGQALEPWTHETLVSPSGEGFQKKIHRWLVWSGQRRDVDELDGISPAKVISECLLSNYNVCQPCANVPITAIIGHRKDYCSILWMEKLRLTETKLLPYCHRTCSGRTRIQQYVYLCPSQFSSVQSLSCVRLFVTAWITAYQAFLSITNSRSSLKLTSFESVMPSSHLILCRPLLLLLPNSFGSLLKTIVPSTLGLCNS